MILARFAVLLCLVPTFAAAQGTRDTLACDVIHLSTKGDWEDYLGGLERGCSLACAFGWTIQPTSTLESQGGNSYSTKNLSDAKLETAWVEGAPGYGVGVELHITFDAKPYNDTVPLWGFEFVNGYAKDKETWMANSRVKYLNVLHNNVVMFTIRLADTDSPQEIRLDAKHTIQLAYGDSVTLVIAGAYPGKRFKDTALSEINLQGAH